MTLAELGAQFREARVHRGLTADDISKSIKISAKIIRAIEDGKRDELPELVFLRGFIKSYGIFLGFSSTDLQKALDHLDAQDPKISARGAEGYGKFTLAQKEVQNKGNNKKIFRAIFVLVICLVFFIVIQFINKEDENSEQGNAQIENSQNEVNVNKTQEIEEIAEEQGEELQEATQAEENLLESQSVEEQVDLVEENNTVDALALDTINEVDVLDEIALITDTADVQNLESEELEPSAEVVLAENIESIDVQPNEEIEVVIEENTENIIEEESEIPVLEIAQSFGSGSEEILLDASEDCWIRINLDNSGRRQSFTLSKGTRAKINFNTKAEIRYGNAGGINVYYKGENLGIAGGLGEVVTAIYP